MKPLLVVTSVMQPSGCKSQYFAVSSVYFNTSNHLTCIKEPPASIGHFYYMSGCY